MELQISLKTAETRRTNIMRKLESRTVARLTTYAVHQASRLPDWPDRTK